MKSELKYFLSVQDVDNLSDWVNEAIALKQNPLAHKELGRGKTLGLVFLNSSLRTRVSSQKAATNLGMEVMVLNAAQEAWTWEFEEDAVMNGNTVEHVKDAARVLSQYCDIIGIRCFAGLKDKADDVNEKVLSLFLKYATVPVISLESATKHPLQSLADCITIEENKTHKKPKVVLTWAPHIKPIPHAVGNSFSEWMQKSDVDFVIANPEGYDLDLPYSENVKVTHNQAEALQDADFVYVKNWSSFEKYGEVLPVAEDWLLTNEKLKSSNNAKIMHCLPVRRNVEVSDEVLDSENSLIYEQAENRVYSAQIVLKKILETL